MLYRKNVIGAENFHIIKTRFGSYQVLKEKCGDFIYLKSFTTKDAAKLWIDNLE